MRPSAFTTLPDGTVYERKGRNKLKADYCSDIENVDRPIPPKPLDRALVRVLQWNVNKLNGVDLPSDPHGIVYSSPDVHDVAALILNSDADIIVLQECGYVRDDIFDIHSWDEPIGKLGSLLFESGYRLLPAGVHCPTVLATRLPSTSLETVPLDQGFRGAGCFCAAYAELKCADHVPLIVYGAHLNFRNTGPFHEGPTSRLDEVKELLRHYHMRCDPDARALIVADFNQQRRRDYLPDEWDRIVARKHIDGDSVDDAVGAHLEAAGFLCCLDHSSADRNWRGDLPPMTHWSGTIIDYAFGRNTYPIGVYIAMTTLSDHLPLITDWTMGAPSRRQKTLQVLESNRRIGRMLMCSIILVGCSFVIRLRGRRQ